MGRKVDAFRALVTGTIRRDWKRAMRANCCTRSGRRSMPAARSGIALALPGGDLADAAAHKEGEVVDYRAVVGASRAFLRGAHDVALIEGAGGVMAPFTDDRTMLDFAVDVRLPAILVIGSYLGTLSHTLTALAVLEA